MGEALALLYTREDNEETYCDVLFQNLKEAIEKDARYLKRLGTLDAERDKEQIADFLKLSPMVYERKLYWTSILDQWKPFLKAENALTEMDMEEESSKSEFESSASEEKGAFFDEYDFQVDSPNEEYSFAD